MTVACPQWFLASRMGKKSFEMTSRSPRVFVTRENAKLFVYQYRLDLVSFEPFGDSIAHSGGHSPFVLELRKQFAFV